MSMLYKQDDEKCQKEIFEYKDNSSLNIQLFKDKESI